MSHFLGDKSSHKAMVYLPVLLVLICLILAGIYIDRVKRQALEQEKRYASFNQLSIVRAQLEGNISSNAQLIKGLVVSLSLEPDMSHKRFKELTDPLFSDYSQVRNIAAAPDLIIRYMNPVKGNEAAIGLDYRKQPDQYEGVKLAKETGKLIMVGPVNLVQGGQGFIVRVPVFTTDKKTGTKHFWGVIASVIDVKRFFDVSGINNIQQSYDIAIRRNSMLSAGEKIFYGDPSVFSKDPVLNDIVLPYGSWTLAAVPVEGWQGAAEEILHFRLKIFLIELLLLFPFIVLAYSIYRKRESDARLRVLFQSSPVGIALNDFETGKFIEVNDALLEPIDYTKDELLKLSYQDVTPDRYIKTDEEQLQSLVETGRYGPYEKEFYRKDGTLYPALLRGILVNDTSEGKLIWSFVEDISSRKKAEIALQRSQKMDAIGQLSGGIAHDFNNILNIIIGNLELLRVMLGEQAENINKRIDSIQLASERATDLTKQLLSFARTKPSSLDIVNINLLVEKMDTLIVRSATPEVNIVHQLAEDVWLTQVDQGEFEDVLLNLCINACDAMSLHGQLTIATRNVHISNENSKNYPGSVPGDFVELAVKDTGEGISDENLQHIFEPFFTTKNEANGTGLGLSMVYGFVYRSGGFINVDTELNVGTNFKLYFPRVYGEATISSHLHIESFDELPGGNETILVVDDEAELLKLLSEQLSLLGYKVLSAENAQQAINILDNDSSIQMVFSDVVMPGEINGYGLAEYIIHNFPHIKLQLASGYTGKVLDNVDVINRLESEILTKPYSISDLAKIIRKLFD